jgi:hypothetical protein
MVYSELATYIREQTQQGIPADVLRQTLMEAGWLELDIENALHDVAAGMVPLTEGVSLHEDVSQVRTMVAHLASRVRVIESRLVANGALPMQGELPTGTIGPEHELPPGRHGHVFMKVAGIVVVFLLFAGLGFYMRFSDAGLAPRTQFVVAVVGGLAFLAVAVVAMRRHAAWLASLSTAVAVASWALATYVAWQTYHSLEWTTVAAIGVLLLVLTVVMGRWIDRLSH